MKIKEILIGIMLSGALFFAWTPGLYAQSHAPTLCGAYPGVLAVKQTDGTTLDIIGKGNAVINYTETSDGYSIIKNQYGIYEYAKNEKGFLVPTGTKAHNPSERTTMEMSVCSHLVKGLRYSKSVSHDKLAQFNALFNKRINKTNSTQSSNGIFPNKGKRKILMLLIQYPDLEKSHPVNDFKKLMNMKDYNSTGSFHDYYMANSFDQLDLTVDVFGWYMAANNYEYYGLENGYDRAAQLGAEAIDAAFAAGVDFSQYDNDGDGAVDGIMFVHSGPGAEVGSQKQYMWSHRYNLSNSGNSRTYNNVLIDDYMFQPELFYTNITGIGVFCHEFGHGLGLPDLYDIDYSTEGVGNYSIMGGGCYLNNMLTPSCFDAWSKTDLKWMEAEVLDTVKKNTTYTLNCANSHKKAYKIPTERPNEFFLLESRELNGFDAYLPSHGLAIWHIDTNRTTLFRSTGSNEVNADESDPGVSIVQADGQDDLFLNTNRGDDGDLYPGSTYNNSFTDVSYPASVFYDGNDSKLKIDNILEIGDSAVTFGYQLAVTAIAGLNSADKINIYPNPAVSKFNIDIADDIANAKELKAEMFDIRGSLIYTTKINKGTNVINTESFEKGMYYLKLNNGAVRKIVIN